MVSLRGTGAKVEEARRVRNAAIVADASTMTKRQLEAKHGICFTGIALILKQAGAGAVYDRRRAGKNIIYNWKTKKVRLGNETHLTCRRCDHEKPVDQFYSTGFLCRKCTAEKASEWNKGNPARRKNITSKYDGENREEGNRKGRERYNRNLKKERARSRKYYYANKVAINKKMATWIRKKLQTSPQFRMKVILRDRIWRLLKNKGGKRNSSEWLIGMRHLDFIKYIESLWLPGMTWDNYAHKGWHLDHIRPCRSFNLRDIDEQKLCFNYKNLRPLWSNDNWTKGGKWNPDENKDIDGAERPSVVEVATGE